VLADKAELPYGSKSTTAVLTPEDWTTLETKHLKTPSELATITVSLGRIPWLAAVKPAVSSMSLSTVNWQMLDTPVPGSIPAVAELMLPL